MAAIGAYLMPSSSKLAVTRSRSPLPLFSSPQRLALSLRSSSAISLNPLRLSERMVMRGGSGAMYATCAASDVAQLRSAREEIKELLKTKFCHPILVRLGWHDAGTYDKNMEEWMFLDLGSVRKSENSLMLAHHRMLHIYEMYSTEWGLMTRK